MNDNDKVKRILIVHLYQPGSAATNRIIAYARSFYALGYKVTLFLGSDGHLPLPELNGVDVIGVSAPCHSLILPRMANRVRKSYDKNSIILVYGSPSLCLFLCKNRYNIFYECTEVPLYGRSNSYFTIVKEKFKILLAKQASGMLVISKALKEYFCQKGVKKIEVVNMFVDVARFDIEVTKAEKPYVAYCGTVSPFKDGVDCLIMAFAGFLKFHSNYQLKIIGKFESDESEQGVRNLAKELGILEHVDFTGMVSPSEMPSLLKGATMLALARPNNRQAQFGFPTKLGEYLATGNPVVVTDVGEISDFLSDGENCRMAKPGDVEDFADKMAWIADHSSEALTIGMKGKELTRSVFSALEQSRKALDFMTANKKESCPK